MQNIGSSGPVRHLVLSDGLASVSVFIEPRESSADATKSAVSTSSRASSGAAEFSRVGSALAYSTEAHEHRITAVGEVPANTLRAIATSVQREWVDAQSKTPNATVSTR